MMPGTIQKPKLGNPRLHAAIVESGLTYEEVADRLKLDPKTVQRWVYEPGRRPYAHHAYAVGQVLGVDPWELWPAMRSPQSQAAPAVPRSACAAREVLAQVEKVDVTTASTVELAMHVGALSASLRAVLSAFEAEAEEA
ncbi:helix-turn-helix transcriptional regulator [Streptomyces albus subsp. chlorinus]|uniref:helix-turn-helix domain-containing protein n=1 Tax=Streptomyces albus TaxID=1888 RepID=UPI00156D67C1|nr:helix-turn-helix transcriptional regulator [Streptomyces albus]NSC21360.1 helix-turn-helix transcriptional regulator [Streptomyces albus subsp. chlorinus]